MTDDPYSPYSVEIDPSHPGCGECGEGRKWWIVGPDGRGGAISYDDLGDAIEIADCLNDAYHLGLRHGGDGRNK